MVMNFDLKEIFTAFMVLFAVIDIVGNIPIIIEIIYIMLDFDTTDYNQ